MPQQPENHKILQQARLSRAIEDKLPKLKGYKERGFKTALLLEDIAGIPLGSTQKGHRMSPDERSRVKNTVDYLVVFASNEGRMIVGDVWKEKSVWYSSIPYDRRFSFRHLPWQGNSYRNIKPDPQRLARNHIFEDMVYGYRKGV